MSANDFVILLTVLRDFTIAFLVVFTLGGLLALGLLLTSEWRKP